LTTLSIKPVSNLTHLSGIKSVLQEEHCTYFLLLLM